MNEKLNIAELLKGCPKGMKLYSPIFGNVCLYGIRPSLAVVVRTADKQTEEFLYDGRFGINGECMLFPSKENRNWSTFQRPFKDGDVLITDSNALCIYKSIHKTYKHKSLIDYYCGYRPSDNQLVIKTFTDSHFGYISEAKLATEEEKQKLFQAIKDNGYKWNPRTKTLEKLIEPKFKVGDRVLWNYDTKIPRTISEVKLTSKGSYVYWIDCKGCSSGWWNETELTPIPNKFDITTLKPFDRVLVRDCNEDKWNINFFGYYRDDGAYQCMTFTKNQCIPYESNKHLLGTTNDCDDYFKTWE